MSVNAPIFYAQQFADQVMLTAQQKSLRIESAFTTRGGFRGEQASPVDQVLPLEAIEKNERFASMPRIDPTFDRRWIVPQTWHVPVMYDKHDLIRQIQDPRGELAAATVAAMNRRKELIALGGLLGTNLTGKNGTTQTAFPSSQSVSVNTGGTASLLNVAKIRKAKQILMANDVDVTQEEIYLALDSRAYDALFAEIQITSKDYNATRDGAPVMKDGIIDRFLGVNFIWTERLLTFIGADDAAGTSTPCVMWAKSGAFLGTWADTSTRIDERTDITGIPWQLYCDGSFGACRLEEKKVVRIWSR